MYRNRLRIYHGPEKTPQTASVTTVTREPATVTVDAGEVFAALADAAREAGLVL